MVVDIIQLQSTESTECRVLLVCQALLRFSRVSPHLKVSQNTHLFHMRVCTKDQHIWHTSSAAQ